ncbi:MAG: ABC transporter substrate-binding protein [Deltaproteobacteria bacterium]|nr:ABC transporter substrate-binding protein [Deltaproteobacteria bacterium]
MKYFKSLVLVGLWLLTLSSFSQADEFTRGVYPATPPSAFTLYSFDPELMGAWNTPLFDYEKRFIPEKHQKLPILGGWYGQGFVPDREMLMASGLKKAFLLENSFFNTERIRGTLKDVGMELLTAPSAIEALPLCFRTMGQIFNRQERGEELGSFAEKVLNSLKPLAAIPEAQKPRVYLAMDADGLATSCSGESRSTFILLAGGRNAMLCSDAVQAGRPRISFEEIMALDPDVILAESYPLKQIIDQEERWKKLRAARLGRVYLVPRGPFSWNGHPSLTSLMGARWLANLLYPDMYPLDVIAATKEFNRLFFRLDFSDQMARELLDPSLATK